MAEVKMQIHVPLDGNNLLDKALTRINSDEEIAAMWEMTNTTEIIF